MILASNGIIAGKGSVPMDADAQAFITATTITDSTQQSAINVLVTSLKSANLWSKMKAIYPLVGGTAEKHRWNLKNPSQYKIDWFGGGTHSSNGYLPNGLSYGNTNFIPTIDYSVNNSAHISFYSRTNSSEAQFNEMGCYQANYLVITLRRSDQSQNTFLYANTLSGGINFFDSNSLGLYVSNRINNQANGYKNGVSKGSNTVADNARNNLAVIIGANNSSNNNVTQYSNRECAFATIGDGLTDTEATNFYTAVQTFQVALSRNV